MNKFYIIIGCLIVLLFSVASCSKDNVEYDTTDLKSNMAEFQIHYCAPITNVSANYINEVLINDSLYANTYAPLKPNNAIPNGAVGRFYSVSAGSVNIKLFTGATNFTQVYDQTCTLNPGKQNIFVYDLNKAPIVFDNGYPYTANITANTDSTCWVKFYNFMYENATTPTTLKLQYKCYCKNPSTGLYTDTVAVGKPVAFGETTGWQSVKVLKSIFNSSGYCSIYYLIDVIDNNGNVVGSLQITNSSGKTVNYSDYWTGYIGRRYHHVFGGIRTSKTLRAAVSVFTAL